MRRPVRAAPPRRHRLVTGLLVTVLVVACGGPSVDQPQLEQALSAISAWLQVDDDGGDTDEAVRRADRLLETTAPIVEARPDISDLTAAQEARFHDALAALRASVADQREVLAGCELDDPGRCLARSDLDPRELARAVSRFQEALAPLDRPVAAR